MPGSFFGASRKGATHEILWSGLLKCKKKASNGGKTGFLGSNALISKESRSLIPESSASARIALRKHSR